MKATTPFFIPVCMLLIMSSCSEALHRGIPKAKAHHGNRELSEFREKQLSAEHVIRTDKRVAAERPEDPQPVATMQEDAAIQIEPGIVPAQVQDDVKSQFYVKPSHRVVLVNPEDDTLEIDEAVIDEALESERIAHQAYQFSFLPIFTLIFFPMLFVGVIGTLSKLARFRKYEYVTEKGLEYERKAKRTLLASIFIPLLVVALFVVVLIAVL